MIILLHDLQDALPVRDPPQLTRLLHHVLEWTSALADCREDDELEVSLVDAATMAEINERHLGHDGPTDVITFDYREAEPAPAPRGEPRTVAEVVVCPEVALRVAPLHEQTAAAETVLYLMHGLLHLAGHDDVAPSARDRMRRTERTLMPRLAREFTLAELFAAPARPAAADEPPASGEPAPHAAPPAPEPAAPPE